MYSNTYSACKHGPAHLRKRPKCGFGHRLGELSIPRAHPPRIWQNRAHKRGSPATIDWFSGQAYSPEQMQRVVTLMAAESPEEWQRWACMLAWFLEMLPASEFVSDNLFGWEAHRNRTLGTALPFELARDADGHTLAERIAHSQDTSQWFPVWVAGADFTSRAECGASTSTEWVRPAASIWKRSLGAGMSFREATAIAAMS